MWAWKRLSQLACFVEKLRKTERLFGPPPKKRDKRKTERQRERGFMCLAVGGGAVGRKILGLLIRVLSLLTSIKKINQKKILICSNLEDTFVHKHRLLKSSCSFIRTECQMDSFSSSPSSGLGESSQISTEDLMDNVKTQLAQAYAQEFLETLRDKCFEKCITKPGSSLSGSEGSCISRCVDRYIEATGIVSRALFNAQR